jgi:hypothetical protein
VSTHRSRGPNHAAVRPAAHRAFARPNGFGQFLGCKQLFHINLTELDESYDSSKNKSIGHIYFYPNIFCSFGSALIEPSI